MLLCRSAGFSVEDDAVVLRLEPLHAILLFPAVRKANLSSAELPVLNSAAWPGKMHVEVHAIDASARVVFDAQVNVLSDAEAEASIPGEILLSELVLFDLQALLENLFGLLAPHSHMACNLLVAAYAERTNSHSALGEERLLLRKLLEHLGCAGEAIAALTDANVQHELL